MEKKCCENCDQFRFLRPERITINVLGCKVVRSEFCLKVGRATVLRKRLKSLKEKGVYRIPCMYWNERDIEEEIVSEKTW